MKEKVEDTAILIPDCIDEDLSDEVEAESGWVPVAMRLALSASEKEIGAC